MKIKKIHPKILRIGELELLFVHHNDRIKPFLSNPDKYDDLANRFIKSYSNPKEFPKFRQISFPFTALSFIDYLDDIFDILPEFIASIIEIGFAKLILIDKNQKFDTKKHVELSISNLEIVCAIINKSLHMANDYLSSGSSSQSIRIKVFENLDQIVIERSNTNILGCLQILHEYLYTVLSEMPNKEGDYKLINERKTNYPINEMKFPLLKILVKPITEELYKLDYLTLQVNAEERDKETKPKEMCVKNLFLGRDDIRWKNVEIILTSNDAIRIKTKGLNEKYTYTSLGMDDGRKKDLPDVLWKTLVYFAENNGKISHSEGITFLTRSKIEKTVSRLRIKLNFITGLKEKPITNYSKTESYITKFNIRDNRLDKPLKSNVDESEVEDVSLDDPNNYVEVTEEQNQYPDLDYYDS